VTFLEKILTSRRTAVEELKRTPPDVTDAPPVRDFRGALTSPGMSLIAEIKRRSPSKGDLNPALDPASLARTYESAGARAISVLCEPEFFSGSADDLVAARNVTTVPVLWKDFILDAVQLEEARARGADAALLIVRMLGDELSGLVERSKELGLCPLVEIFDEDDLERALAAGADVVGVNHRDLETFEEDPTATKRLRPLVGGDVILVAESAISTRADVQALEDIGVHAMLVGEAIVTNPDPAAKIRELLGT
jgi:indole-3-glycerol phosphate synthase